MKKALRIVHGLLFALAVMILTYAWARAESYPSVDTNEELDCAVCHAAFFDAWQNSAHGQATTDPVFRETWQKQGGPRECLPCHTTGYDAVTDTWKAEGVTCEACHAPYAEQHPRESMPVDRTPNLCGTCHQETVFEWQISQHRQEGITCVSCHGPHSTDLKADDPDDPSSLCNKCHPERVEVFAHSQHKEVGLSCADCHLGPEVGALGLGKGKWNHSFSVRLSTCDACHETQIHGGIQTPAPTPAATVSATSQGVSLEPNPTSPFGFVLISGLIGMAAGMILSPWLERWYRKVLE
jgi:predicted CXXCH cytochrome family protein